MAPWEPEGEPVIGPTGTVKAHVPRETTRLMLANAVSSNLGTNLSSSEFKIEGGGIRRGQLPQWLNISAPGVAVGEAARAEAWTELGERPLLRVHHDWSAFTHFQTVDPATQALPESIIPLEKMVGLSERELALAEENAMLKWKLQRLPTFNSMAAEACLGMGLPGLSETFFYSNDDVFIGRKLTTGDFFTPLYGPFLHLDMQTNIKPVAHPQPNSERTSQEYSAWLLCGRFGNRSQGWPYPIHIQKAHLKPIVHKARLMWAQAFEDATSRRWRADGKMANSHMLSYSGLLIERHREALLWSFFVARLDHDGDGVYSKEELEQGLIELGDEAGRGEAVLDVKESVRDSTRQRQWIKNLEQTNFPAPNATRLLFTSHDGYVLIKSKSELAEIAEANEANVQQADRQATQSKRTEESADETEHLAQRRSSERQSFCEVDLRRCWPKISERDPIAVFKNMAFQVPECGDCVILQLINRSGRRGLSAFLPSSEAVFPKLETDVVADDITPHLPLDDDWTKANFTLASVARFSGWKTGSNRRLFSGRLIQRYSYAIGATPAEFHLATNLKQTKIESVPGGAGFICINDDIVHDVRNEAVGMLQRFFEKTWPWLLPFERE